MDTNLRKRIRAGDHAAFGELFDAYARSVYNHAYRLTGEWTVAEDVVSLTFLDAWRLRAKLDEEGGSLRPWLLGIATNVTLPHSRLRSSGGTPITRLRRPKTRRRRRPPAPRRDGARLRRRDRRAPGRRRATGRRSHRAAETAADRA
ncbi:sigma factor [Streptomyces sp. NL15-2K]|nr:sigma factor [Kutzneria buriramensis]WKX11577.1 sigma factor [Kutzneria buriramensis]GCB47010.1 sigma factor [Streptomyces sp. NL15-2K]